MLIFFDFDGTLTNMNDRWWHVHVDAMQKFGCVPILKKKYLSQKRNGIPEVDIVDSQMKNKIVIKKYTDYRGACLEKRKYLVHDFLIPYGRNILEAWKQQGELVLLTKRSSKKNVLSQLKSYGIKKYFSRILVTEGREKQVVLQEIYSKKEINGAWLITDSVEECVIGKKLCMKVLAIGYGTRSPSYFQKKGISDIIRTPKQLLNPAQYVSKTRKNS